VGENSLKNKQSATILSTETYIPKWHEEFFCSCDEFNRQGFVSALPASDEALDLAAKVMKLDGITVAHELLPMLNEYLRDEITLYHLKWAYMLLLAKFDETQITKITLLFKMTQKSLEGLSNWKDVILSIVDNKVNPAGEDPYRHLTNQPLPVIKTQQCTLEIE
jgi:hypothetical protein